MSSSTYVVSDADREAFKRDGFVHLKGVLTNEEVCTCFIVGKRSEFFKQLKLPITLKAVLETTLHLPINLQMYLPAVLMFVFVD